MTQIYMQYICKCCGRIYLDKDVKGRMTPIKGYYCPKCCAKYGLINPPFPPKRELSDLQVKTLQKYQFPKGKNRLYSNENTFLDTDKGETQND